MELTLDKKFDKRELALVWAARNGDREAIEQLLVHNWDWLKALVMGIVRRTAEVDDVLQEICIRVINKIDQLREPHSYRAWLACLARREAIKWCRQRTRQGQAVPPSDRHHPERQQDGAKEAELSDEYAQVLCAAHALPDKYREVLFLQHSRSLSYKEIAAILEVPLTTVQIRLVRARRMILARLQEKKEPQRI